MLTKIIIIVIIGAVAAAPKATNNIDLRIFGGDEAAPKSEPYFALLEINRGPFTIYCDGSLFMPTKVLTSAECVKFSDTIVVTLGIYNASRNGPEIQKIKASNYVVHPDSDSLTNANDIAVVTLEHSVNFTDYVQLVPLETEDNDLIGVAATVSGVGVTNENNTWLSDVIMVVNTTVIDNQNCAEYYEELTDNTFCMDGSKGTTCSGDTGGPVVINGFLAGVIGDNRQQCTPGKPIPATKVSRYIEFIVKNL